MDTPVKDKAPLLLTNTYIGDLKIDAKFKVVIGIDLGTTYSGTAAVLRDSPEVVNCGAPSASNTRDETKAPTVLLRLPDDKWLFGNDALEKYRDILEECKDEVADHSNDSMSDRMNSKGIALFQRYKMELKDKFEGNAEDLMVKSTKSTMEQKHKLLDLMSKTLEFLSEYAFKEVQRGWAGALQVTRDEVLWVLTVPAIWNDYGKAFMRKAAFQAGLICEESSDHLLLALEPESASIAVHAEGHGNYKIFKQGVSFLNLDIGGGTADFTVHHVATEKPLKLDETAPPTGGAWGGTYVDEQFETFLRHLFGQDNFKKLEACRPADIAEIMDEFRALKEGFDPDSEGTKYINLGGLFSDGIADELCIPSLLELVKQYNLDANVPFDLSKGRVKKEIGERDKLPLSRDKMMEFFEPTLQKICDCVTGILTKNEDISILSIVGGYGSSKVLHDRIKEEFGKAPFFLTVLIPNGMLRPQAAIMQGAAYFGLYTSVIGKRFTKYTYGVRTTRKWYEGCGFSIEEAELDSKLNELRVSDVFDTIVKQGSLVAPLQKFTSGRDSYSPVYKDQTRVGFDVFQSESYSPKRATESKCKKIGHVTIPCKPEDSFEVSFTFGTQIGVEVIRQDGEVRSTTVMLD